MKFLYIITKNLGELYTWGKGRYGRLGHGDSEDQMKPKLVEALLGYRVIDVACGKHFYKVTINYQNISNFNFSVKFVLGSGDAQTLCITDDDNVWSWGDGNFKFIANYFLV